MFIIFSKSIKNVLFFSCCCCLIHLFVVYLEIVFGFITVYGICYDLLLNHLHEHVCGQGFGTFDGQAQSTIPDEGGQHTESAGYTEQDGVVVHFLHAVVLQQDTGVSIYIGPGVLDLAGFSEDWGHDLVDLGNQLEEFIVGQMLEGELALAGVAGIGLTEHSVTVTGNDLAGLEGLPDVVLELFL